MKRGKTGRNSSLGYWPIRRSANEMLKGMITPVRSTISNVPSDSIAWSIPAARRAWAFRDANPETVISNLARFAQRSSAWLTARCALSSLAPSPTSIRNVRKLLTPLMASNTSWFPRLWGSPAAQQSKKRDLMGGDQEPPWNFSSRVSALTWGNHVATSCGNDVEDCGHENATCITASSDFEIIKPGARNCTLSINPSTLVPRMTSDDDVLSSFTSISTLFMRFRIDVHFTIAWGTNV
mmetsp:Transcript_44140/g.93936  ORF Transcript_44140/g.93936 Transcript_44140/m.93936 type:complete len:238 (+) Transcript_44140:51-764(+)